MGDCTPDLSEQNEQSEPEPEPPPDPIPFLIIHAELLGF